MNTHNTTANTESRRRHWPALMLMALLPITLLFGAAIPAQAEVHVSIGVNFPVYPDLVLVPGYPVYYAPQADANYFFYDGEYWVFADDNWYSSPWYNGPWDLVAPEFVPLYVLRVPVRYYRAPPLFFRGWLGTAPPRWGEHWGHAWERHRAGWNHWNHHAVPHAAPLPLYQRRYSGDRYPHAIAQQHSIRVSHYKYRPHTAIAREHFEHREQPHGFQDRGNTHHENARPAPTRTMPPRTELHPEQHRAAPPQHQSERHPEHQAEHQAERQLQHPPQHQFEPHPPQTHAPPTHAIAVPPQPQHARPPHHEEHHEQHQAPPHPQAATLEPPHEQPARQRGQSIPHPPQQEPSRARTNERPTRERPANERHGNERDDSHDDHRRHE